MKTKDRPMLMSGPMVRALNACTKTQTRRTIKTQPSEIHFTPERHSYLTGARVEIQAGKAWAVFEYTMGEVEAIPCPYGKPGDRLWVRESWCEASPEHRDHRNVRQAFYKADGESEEIRQRFIQAGHDYRWRPSIHMPRWACRLTLEIIRVRVERLQDISEVDCIAEGIEGKMSERWPGKKVWRDYLAREKDVGPDGEWFERPKDSYRSLWESINGPGSWALNPWVWVVEFKRVEGGRGV